MLRRMLLILLACLCFAVPAWAAVDVNTADQTTLESVKGLGPVKSKAIIDERNKNGPFRDAKDLADRVKGLGAKSVANLQEQGLTIGASAGSARKAPGGPASVTTTPSTPQPAASRQKPTTAPPGQTPTATTGASSATTAKTAGTTAGGMAASAEADKTSKSTKKKSKTQAADQTNPGP